jgi:hypothetical protein
MLLQRPHALVLLLATGLTSGCPSDTPGPPIPGDEDDDATSVQGGLPALGGADWIPDRACEEALVLSTEWPAVETLGLLHVSVQGGSGDAEVTMVASPSGAIFDAAVGTYIAGTTAGVTDRLVARDRQCFGEADLTLDVVSPLEVRPTGGQVLPGDAFTFEVVGGSGETTFTPGPLRSGGSLEPDGAYVAGPADGIDEAEVLDDRTGRTVPVTLSVSASAELAGRPARLVVPLGVEADLLISGGSGWFDLVPDTSTPAALDGATSPPSVLALSPGDVRITVQDRFSSLTSTVVVQVVDTQQGDALRAGHGTFRGLALGPGDIDGDGFPDALLGVMEASVGGHRSGGLYVYAGGPAGLAPTPARVITWPEWFAEMAEDFAVEDLDGDGLLDLIVGVTRADRDRSAIGYPPLEDTGAVAIYAGVPSGFFASEPTSIVTGEDGSDHFGKSLAVCDLNGDGFLDLAVGARYADDSTGSPVLYNAGAVQLHLGDGTGAFSDVPDQVVFGSQPDGAGGWQTDASQEMGYDLAGGDFDGDGLCDLAVGSYNRSSGPGRSRDNLVTIWRGQADDALGAPAGGGVLPFPVLAIAPQAPEADQGYFGREVKLADLDGDGKADLLVPQHRYTEPTLSGVYHGALRIYEGRTLGSTPAAGITPADTAVWIHTGTNSYDYVGAQVDVYDVSGDGLLDLVVGDSREEGGGSPNDAGVLTVFLGQPNAFPETAPTWEVFGAEGDGRLGVAVAGLGDVDGDGAPDLLGFGSQEDLYGENVGVPWFYSGIDGARTATPLELPGVIAGESFGDGGDLVGDVNGDGFDDLLVGASEATLAAGWKAGAAYLYLGSASGFGPTPDVTLSGFAGNTGSDRAGWAVSPAGDFDGDGLDDFAIVARYEDKNTNLPSGFNDPGDCPAGTQWDVGAVYVFRGTSAGQPPPSEPAFVIYGPQAYQRIDNVDSGDLNGDGLGDLAFSGYDWDRPGASAAGGFAAVLGRPWSGSGVDAICSYDVELLGAEASYYLGRDLAFLGDVDGDGCDELAVGAFLADWTASNEGAVHVLKGWGGPACPAEPRQVILSPQDANDQAGIGVGGGGDVDGDGIPDLAVGAPYWYANSRTRGSAWLVPGAWIAQLTAEPLDPDGVSIVWPFWPVTESAREDWRIDGIDIEGRFGWDVSIVPDYAGGRGALAVGAPRGAEWSGGVELFEWTPAGGGLGRMSQEPVASFVGELERDGQSGSQVHGGTVNGVPALVIGAPRSDARGLDRGASWIVELTP